MRRPHDHALVAYELYTNWQPSTTGLFFTRYKGDMRLLRLTTSYGSKAVCLVPKDKQVRLLLTWQERCILPGDNITNYVDYFEWLAAHEWLTH